MFFPWLVKHDNCSKIVWLAGILTDKCVEIWSMRTRWTKLHSHLVQCIMGNKIHSWITCRPLCSSMPCCFKPQQKKKENAKCSGDISFHVHAAYFHFNVPLLRENHQSLHGSIFHTEVEHSQTLACLKILNKIKKCWSMCRRRDQVNKKERHDSITSQVTTINITERQTCSWFLIKQ